MSTKSMEDVVERWDALQARCPRLTTLDPFGSLQARLATFGGHVSIRLPLAKVVPVMVGGGL